MVVMNEVEAKQTRLQVLQPRLTRRSSSFLQRRGSNLWSPSNRRLIRMPEDDLAERNGFKRRSFAGSLKLQLFGRC